MCCHPTAALEPRRSVTAQSLIFKRLKTWPNDIETFRIIYRWKGMEVYFLLQFMEWHFNVCRKSYGQWSDQRSEMDNNRVALFWWSLWRFQNQSKRLWNITNNISLERYKCLVCPEIYKTQFETLCKKLWSQDHTKVSFEKHLNHWNPIFWT